MNDAAMSMGIKMSAGDPASNSFIYIPSVEIAGLYVSSMFNIFEELEYRFPQ